ELRGRELTRRVGAAFADESRLRTELGRPRGDVRGLSAGAGARRRSDVAARDDRLLDAHDHVEQQVAERADPHAAEPTILPWTARTGARGFAPSHSAASSAPRPSSRPHAGNARA